MIVYVRDRRSTVELAASLGRSFASAPVQRTGRIRDVHELRAGELVVELWDALGAPSAFDADDDGDDDELARAIARATTTISITLPANGQLADAAPILAALRELALEHATVVVADQLIGPLDEMS